LQKALHRLGYPKPYPALLLGYPIGRLLLLGKTAHPAQPIAPHFSEGLLYFAQFWLNFLG
jgi:hypothetical protein